MMIAATLTLVFASATSDLPVAAPEDVYTCEYLATDSTEPHEPLRADLVLRNRPDKLAGKWTVIWPGKEPIEAENFPAQYGSVGGSAAFRWTEADGKLQTGYLSFSDIVVEDGTKAAWLGLGKPSLWQAPGYLCATGPANQTKGNQ